MLKFQALSTPSGDGETLVEPTAQKLPGLTEANRRLLADAEATIHGRPISELRAATRSTLVGATDVPIIVTGHQPEFYHAGVWAKNVVAARLAQALGGRALNLVVDNDAPKKTSLAVPHERDGVLTSQEKAFAEYRVGWAFEQFEAMSRPDGRRLLDEIRAALGDQAYEHSALPLMAQALTNQEQAGDYVDQITAARKAVEAHFGLDLVERRVSQCWGGEFLLDVLANADRFAACYNDALTDYRKAVGIAGRNRPIPDLIRDGDRIELPVWVYRHAKPRRRLFVERSGDKLTFHAEATPMGALGLDDLRQPDGMARLRAVIGWRFRPRALTLTTWARLLLADLFIHGIGGAKYDRITDRLIELYYGLQPPAMACVSATVRMPLERFPVDRSDQVRARRKCRDVRYNPQRYVSVITADMSGRLQARVDAIAESERLKRQDRLNRNARRDAWLAVRKANADLLLVDPTVPDRLEAEADRIERQLAHNNVADSREYFFGMLPMDKLARLLDALPSADDFRLKPR
ncbi:MAG: hypothetical protein JXQ73_11870 [Phycisphaerae bacterium]|nr:hypothetical protein [Phycisphaerae bacterium]